MLLRHKACALMTAHSNLPFRGQEVTPATVDAERAEVHHKYIHTSAIVCKSKASTPLSEVVEEKRKYGEGDGMRMDQGGEV